MAQRKFNSVEGFSVGIPGNVISVIDNVANVYANRVFVQQHANLGDIGNIYIGGGLNNQVLKTDGTGNLYWALDTAPAGGNATEIQFNTSGSLDGSSAFTFDKIANTLTITGNITSDNANLGNLATANYLSGDGYLLSNITPGNINGQVANALIASTVYSNAQPNITSVGALSGLSVLGTGSISGANLVSANYFTGTLTTAVQPNITSVGSLDTLNVLGNITSANASLGNLVTANYFSGNGSLLTGVIGNANYAAYAGNVTIGAQPNITSVGELTSLIVTGVANVVTGLKTANIQGPDGTVTIQTEYNTYVGDVGIRSNLTVGSSGTGNLTVNGISDLGPVANVKILGGTANYMLVTDGAGALSWASPVEEVIAGTDTQVQFNDNGVFGADGNFTYNKTTDTLNVKNITLEGTGTANLGNYAVSNYFSGDGRFLTNITGANVTSEVGNANIAWRVSANDQPNITSLGTLSSLNVTGDSVFTGNVTINGTNGNLSVTNLSVQDNIIDISAETLGTPSNNAGLRVIRGDEPSVQLRWNESLTTWQITNDGTNYLTIVGKDSAGNATVGNLSATNLTGTLTTAIQPNITSVGTLVDANINGNVLVGGNLTVNGTTYYTNVDTLAVEDPIIEQGGGPNASPLTNNDGKDRGSLLHYYTTKPVDAFMGWDNSASEFAFGSNVSVSGEIVTFNDYGNVHAGYFIGNGSQLTGIIGTSNYAAYAGNVTNAVQPNITSVGTLASLSVTANVTSGNAALGNLVTANYFSGDGSQLTNLTAGTQIRNGTSNVSIPSTNSNVTVGVNGTSNVVVVSTDSVTVAGNLYVSSNILRDNKNVSTYVSATSAPTNPVTGDQWYDQVNDVTYQYIYDGTSHFWVDISSGYVASNVNAIANTLVLRNSFGNVYANGLFANILTVAAKSNLGIAGNVIITGGTAGQYLQTDGAGNLSWSSVTSGSTSNISNGTSNVNAGTLNGNVTVSVGGTSNTVVFTGTGVNVAGYINAGTGNIISGNANLGNLVTSNYFSGNGSLLTGLNASNVASGTIPSSILGNSSLYVGTTSIALNRSSGSQTLTGVSIDGSAASATTAGTVTTNAQPNITSVGTLSSLTVTANANVGNLNSSGTLTVAGNTSIGNESNLNFVWGNHSIITNFDSSYDYRMGMMLLPDTRETRLFATGTGVLGGSDGGRITFYTRSAGATGGIGDVGTERAKINVDGLQISTTTTATSTSTGSIVTSGGIGAAGNIYIGGNANISGNVSASYFIGNGSQLTGLPASYSNANVSAYLPTYTGNLTAGNVSATGNITAAYFVGNGSHLTGLPASYSNANVAAYLPTYTGNISANVISSNTVTVGAGSGGSILGANVVSANYFVGNGSLLTGLPAGYANSDVAAYLPTYTGNIGANYITASSNITASYFVGNGSSLTHITGANVDGTVPLATSATTAGTVTTAAQPNITSVGTLVNANIDGNLVVGGNLTVNGTTTYVNVDSLKVEDPIIEVGGGPNGDPLTTNDNKDRGTLLHYYTTKTVDAFMGWDNSNGEFAFGSNVSVSGDIVTFNTFGNVRAAYLIGNVSQATGLNASNLASGTISSTILGNSTLYIGTTSIALNRSSGSQSLTGIDIDGSANYATYAGTVTTAAQPNITSVGTLVNTTMGSSNSLTGGNLVSATYLTGTLTTNAQPNITSVGTLNGLTGSGTINLTSASNVSLGPVGNVHISGGSPGYVLSTDGSGALSWTAQTGGGGGSVTASEYVVKGTLSANQNLNNGSDTVVAFDTVSFDPQSWFNTTSHVVTPTLAGYYKVTFSAWFTQGTSSSGAQYNIQIHKSATGGGTTVIAQQPIIGTNAQTVNTSDTVYMNGSSDYFAFTAYSSIAGQQLQYINGTYFTVELVGSAAATSNIGNGYSNVNIGSANANIQFNVNGTSNVAVISNIGVSVTGNLNTSGNITASYLIGNGSQLTGLPESYANANVAAYLPTYTGNIGANFITASGNITAAYFIGNGSQLTGLPASYANANVTAYLPTYTGDLNPDNLTVGVSANLGAVGNIYIGGGSANYVLATNGTGSLSWVEQAASGGTEITVDNFTGDGSTLAYTLSIAPTDEKYTIVSLGGTFQPRTTYTVSGTTLTFSSAPPDQSPIEVTIFSASSGGGGSGTGVTYANATANLTAVANTTYFVTTSTGPKTITLPASPTFGMQVGIVDCTGNASSNNITIARNSSNIQGAASDMTVSVNRGAFTLAYFDATQGWLLTNV